MDTKTDPNAIHSHVVYGHRTKGQKIADQVTAVAGSWAFIIFFLGIIILWVIVNGIILAGPWDPFPFILLNLGLSMLAALQAPVILMSQNRAAQRDRRKAELDLRIDTKAEQGVQEIRKELEAIKKILQEQRNTKAR